MRFGFFTSLSVFAAVTMAEDRTEDDIMMQLSQIENWEELSDEQLFAQLGLEDEDEGDYELSEIDSEDLSDDESFAQIENEVGDDEMFNEVAEFLAQIGDDERSTLQSLVGQVLAE